MRSLKQIAEGQGISKIQSMLQDPSMDDICKIAMAGFQHGYRREKKELDFTTDDLMDWLDDSFDLVAEIIQAFSRQVTAYTEGTKKKKVVAKV
jgi:hypothetical protein